MAGFVARIPSNQRPEGHYHHQQVCGSTFQNFASRVSAFLEHGMVQDAINHVSSCRDARFNNSMRYGQPNIGHERVIGILNNVVEVLRLPQVLGGSMTYDDVPMRFNISIFIRTQPNQPPINRTFVVTSQITSYSDPEVETFINQLDNYLQHGMMQDGINELQSFIQQRRQYPANEHVNNILESLRNFLQNTRTRAGTIQYAPNPVQFQLSAVDANNNRGVFVFDGTPPRQVGGKRRKARKSRRRASRKGTRKHRK